MSNKKLILGIAAGAAALAVVGVILKRKGYLDNISTGEFGNNLKDKYGSIKESAKKKFDDVVHKGEELADKFAGSQSQDGTKSASASANGSSAKGRSTTQQGGMNPATA